MILNDTKQQAANSPSYETQFTLDREYLAECFDQSLPHGKNARPNYVFPIGLLVAGSGILQLTDLPRTGGWLLIALAVLELIHIRYRRAWWLARQMWSASANCEVTLTIDNEGIRTKSPSSQTTLLWPDIERVIETELGHILVNKAGAQQYLSKSILPAGLITEQVALHRS